MKIAKPAISVAMTTISGTMNCIRNDGSGRGTSLNGMSMVCCAYIVDGLGRSGVLCWMVFKQP